MSRRARLSVVLFLLAFQGVGAQAGGQATGVQQLPGSRSGGQPLISFDARGGLLATWSSYRNGRGAGFAYAAPDGRPFVRTQSGPLEGGRSRHPFAFGGHGDGEGDVLSIRRRRVASGRLDSAVVALRRATDGTISGERRLSDARLSADRPVLAVTPRGDAIAAWVALRGGRRSVQYATRAAGQGWDGARAASARGRVVGDLGVDVSPVGGAILGWRRDGRIEVATGVGGRLGSPASVGAAVPGNGGNLDVAVSGTGRALIAWSRVPLSSARDGNHIRAARGTVAGGMAPSAMLDPQVDGSVDIGPQVALGDDGRSLVAWRGRGARGPAVRAVTAGPQEPFGPARDLSLGDGDPLTPRPIGVPQAGVTTSGRAVVAWAEASEIEDASTGAGSVRQTHLSDDGEWLPPETVWSGDGGHPGNLQLATGPRDQVALAWDQLSGKGIFVAAAAR